MAEVTADGRRAGVLDLYRAVWEAGRAFAERYPVAIGIEIAFIVLYVLLRSGPFGKDSLTAWLIGTLVIAVVSPASGLVILAAIAPFSEPLVFTRQLGAKPIVIAVLAAAVGIRLVLGLATDIRHRRPTPRAPMPIVLASLVALGTAVGVVHSYLRFGASFGVDAAQSWLAGIGGAMLVLGIAFWSARRGNLRPMWAAVAAGAIGGIVSLSDWFHATALRESALGWLLRPNRFEMRLTGIIPSPNGVAALVVMPTGVLAAAAVLARPIRLRILAAALILPLAGALYFTYSRAALLGIFAVSVIMAWRVRRAFGAALLAIGIVLGIALLPTYIATRSAAVGGAGDVDPSSIIVASDLQRLTAWQAAARMAAERPLTGHGFLAYGQLHEAYGDPVLRAPHNEWLRLFAEEGGIVGILGLAFIGMTLTALLSAKGWLPVGLGAAVAGWALAATFNNPLGFIQVGIVLGCLAGAGLALASSSDGTGTSAGARPGGSVPLGDPASA